MPRQARIAIPGIPWHIIQRGNNRTPCFYADADYRVYLDVLKEQALKQGCQVHAYVLMTNHVHLLLTPERADSVALLMKHLGQRYVQYVNRTYRRSGTLWEGRFRSCLAQSDQYLLTCQRYIELNPVRACMVDHPADYPWSSYRTNGQGEPSPLISPHPDYTRLGRTKPRRLAAYRELFRAHMEPTLIDQIRAATNSGYVLGNEQFKAEIARMVKRRVAPGKPGRPRKEGA
ncbi:transposase [Ectothiorhodospiraceae bacterium 2226]|nr:transposase [Ectothiorhodospiraceae bacterium 2226]